MNERSKLFTKIYCAMLLCALLNCLFGQASLAAIPVVLNARGISESMSAVLNMLFPLSCIFFRKYSMQIASRYSTRWTSALSFAILLISNILFEKIANIPCLMAIRIFQGLALCYITGVLSALASENVPQDRFEEGVGYFGAVVPVMSFFGPAVGRILVSRLGVAKMLYGLSAIMLIPIFTLICFSIPDLKPVPKKTASGEKQPLLERASIAPSVLLMCVAGAQTSMVSFLPLYAQKYNIDKTLYLYIPAGIGVFTIRILTTILKKKLPDNKSVIASFGVCVLTLLILPKSNNALLYAIFGLCYGFAQGVLQPCFITQALSAAPLGHKSTATVTYYIFNDIGTVVLGMSWGYIAQYISYYAVFLVAACVNIAAFCGWLLLCLKNGQPEQE